MKKGFLLVCFTLCACNTFTPERVSCPKTVILAEFSKTIEFQKDCPIRTEMDSLHPVCTLNGDEVALDMKLRLTSLRPLLAYEKPTKTTPSYFVALIDQTGKVLSRTDHQVAIDFEKNQTTVVSKEQIQEKIPLGQGVTLYVGFNLDEKQMEFFRKEREKMVNDPRP